MPCVSHVLVITSKTFARGQRENTGYTYPVCIPGKIPSQTRCFEANQVLFQLLVSRRVRVRNEKICLSLIGRL